MKKLLEKIKNEIKNYEREAHYAKLGEVDWAIPNEINKKIEKLVEKYNEMHKQLPFMEEIITPIPYWDYLTHAWSIDTPEFELKDLEKEKELKVYLKSLEAVNKKHGIGFNCGGVRFKGDVERGITGLLAEQEVQSSNKKSIYIDFVNQTYSAYADSIREDWVIDIEGKLNKLK